MADAGGALRRAHVDSMRFLLEAERLALGEVARAALPAVTGFLRSLGDASTASHRLEIALVEPLRRARQRGRSASLDGIAGEWSLIRGELVKAGMDPFALPLVLRGSISPHDNAPAVVAAKEIASLYLVKATRSIEKAEGASVSGRSVLPVYAIEEAAATQTAVPFGDERVQVEQRLVAEERGAEWLPLVGKMWDATLDRKTCATCRGLEGQIQLLGLSFDGGLVPASAHRRCRCVQVLIFAPIYLGREDKEAA